MSVSSPSAPSSSAPADGDRPGGALGIGREALDPQQECVAQALRGGAATIEPGGQQLFAIERVALAANEQALDQLGPRSRAENVGERLRQLVAVKWRELDAARPIEPFELGQQRPQRMAAVELIAAVGEQQHHPLLAQAAGEEGAESARRAVGPVHVLQHQHERLLLAEEVEQLHDGLEQLQLRGCVGPVWAPSRVESGQEGRQLRPAPGAQRIQRRVTLAHQWPERAEQRRVGQLAIGLLHALASQGERATREPALELEHQPRLADT